LIVIAIGGTFLYLQKSQIPLVNVQNSNTQTADWKTYTNAEYGFEFKYPPGYEVTDLEKKDFFIVRAAGDVSRENPAYPYLTIEFLSESYLKVLEVEQQKSPQEINNIVIGNVSSKEFLYSSEMGNTFQEIIIPKNNQAIRISSSKGGLLDPLLSTFKFIK